MVGANGCGKSSVLDGMLFTANARMGIGNKEPKDFNYHSLNKNPGYNHEGVIIEFTGGDFSSVYDGKRASGKENTLISFRSPYRYNSNLKIDRSEAVRELRLNRYGASVTASLDDKMEENYRRLNIKFNKYLKDNHATATYDLAKQHIIGQLNASISNCLDIAISSIGDIEAGEGTLYFRKSDHPNEF